MSSTAVPCDSDGQLMSNKREELQKRMEELVDLHIWIRELAVRNDERIRLLGPFYAVYVDADRKMCEKMVNDLVTKIDELRRV